MDPVKKILNKEKEQIIIQNIKEAPPVPNPVTGEYTPKDTSDVLFRQIKKNTIGR